jgi:DNA-binding response OmpR family regulator
MKMPEALYKQYLKSLSDNIEEFRTLAKELRTGNPEAEKRVRAIAHTLHGSGGTFGHPEISEAGRAVEHAEAASLVKQLVNLIQVLKTVIEGGARKKEEPPAAPQAATPAAPDNRPRILLIEDDADSQEMFRALLREHGDPWQLVVAETAGKAMDLVLRQKFSLILLDLVLPDRDGREILRSMKYEFSIKTPVFILSAIEKDVVRVECMSLGADKFILKPYDPGLVFRDINNVLNGRTEALTLVPMGKETDPVEKKKIDATRFSILAADDDLMQGKFIKERLTKEGFRVDHVDSGTAALQAMTGKDYSLLILDVKMPGLDGFEVLKRVRHDMKLPDLPVIMLTAMGSEADIIKAYDLGADDYILKPYSAVQLVARVKTLLRK